MTLTGVRHTLVLTYRENLLSSLETTVCHSTLQSTLSRHQSSRTWRCPDVSGNLSSGTRGLNAGEQTVINCSWWHSRWTCAWIYFLDSVLAVTAARTMRRSWRASVLRGRPEHGLHVWYCTKDDCSKQRHTTDTLCPTCAAIRRYVHSASSRPTRMLPRSNS